jgi:hypothetical protein
MQIKIPVLAAMMAIGVPPAQAVSSSSESFGHITSRLVNHSTAYGIEASLTLLTGSPFGTCACSTARPSYSDNIFSSNTNSEIEKL